MKPKVYLVDQPGYDAAAIRGRARDLFEREGLAVRGATVFVKPSFVYPARPPKNIGINTQPEVVAGVAGALHDLGAKTVWVGEDCLEGPSECGFLAMGVLPALRGIAEPIYLQDEERVEVSVPPGRTVYMALALGKPDVRFRQAPVRPPVTVTWV